MDTKWWKNFINKTNDFNDPFVFKNAFSSNQRNELQVLCEEVISNLNDYDKQRMRVWINGDQNDGKNKKLVLENPPLQGESLELWSKRLFKNQKFGVILNNAHRYNENLKNKIIQLIAPILELKGYPLEGIEVTLFAGNYGFTPLGFHVDPVGHKVMHFHLGPGSKEMYLLNKEEYEGKFNDSAIEDVIPYSQKYEFETHDIFFMPWGKYHIGNSPEFSVGLTVWHIEPTVTDLSGHIFKLLVEKIIGEKNDQIVPCDKGGATDIQLLNQALSSVISIDEEYKSLSIEDFINQTLKEYKLSLYSNCGFVSKTESREGMDIKIYDHVQILTPFKIQFEKINDEKLNIYIRGNKFTIPFHPELISLIDNLNSGNSFVVKDLIQPLLTDWDEDICLYILSEFYKLKGIEIKSGESILTEHMKIAEN